MIGKRGPKKQPAELAKLKGTFEARRYGGTDDIGEFIFLTTKPNPPERLGLNGAEMWNRIFDCIIHIANYISIQDCISLEQICYNYQIMNEAQDDLDKNGITITTVTQKGENKQVNPAFKVYNETYRNFLSGLREFGLTPSSRGSIQFASYKKEKSIKEEFKL